MIDRKNEDRKKKDSNKNSNKGRKITERSRERKPERKKTRNKDRQIERNTEDRKKRTKRMKVESRKEKRKNTMPLPIPERSERSLAGVRQRLVPRLLCQWWRKTWQMFSLAVIAPQVGQIEVILVK